MVQCNSWSPQGTLLGPTSFLLHINCLATECNAIKYFDDATIWEKCARDGSDSKLQIAANEALDWSNKNRMLINTDKTKMMTVYFGRKQSNIRQISMNKHEIESVESFKALGVLFNCKLTWQDHVLYMSNKASKRLYFLVILKRAGLSAEDLTQIYCSIVRSVLEYAAELWHPGLIKEQSKKLEQVQKRAVNIILPGIDYLTACNNLGLDTLHQRRENMCQKFFISVQKEDHKLHNLLPPSRPTHGRTLRNPNKYQTPRIRTERFKRSPIIYGLLNYQ